LTLLVAGLAPAPKELDLDDVHRVGVGVAEADGTLGAPSLVATRAAWVCFVPDGAESLSGEWMGHSRRLVGRAGLEFDQLDVQGTVLIGLVSVPRLDDRLRKAPHRGTHQHPEHSNVWIVGGGSGHGLKHGPPIAERLAATFSSGKRMPADFSLGERSPSRSLRMVSSGLGT
jgi:glycine/D-amino acid oxidase-like deaminating enzyme